MNDDGWGTIVGDIGLAVIIIVAIVLCSNLIW